MGDMMHFFASLYTTVSICFHLIIIEFFSFPKRNFFRILIIFLFNLTSSRSLPSSIKFTFQETLSIYCQETLKEYIFFHLFIFYNCKEPISVVDLKINSIGNNIRSTKNKPFMDFNIFYRYQLD